MSNHESFHPKNLFKSPIVETFLEHLGKSEAGQSIKLIEEDLIVPVDTIFLEKMGQLKENNEVLLARLEELTAENKTLLESGAVIIQFADPIVKNIPKGKKLSKASIVPLVLGLFTKGSLNLELLSKIDWMALKAIAEKHHLITPDNPK